MKKQPWESKAFVAGACLMALAAVELGLGSSTLTEALLRFFEGLGIVGLRQALA